MAEVSYLSLSDLYIFHHQKKLLSDSGRRSIVVFNIIENMFYANDNARPLFNIAHTHVWSLLI